MSDMTAGIPGLQRVADHWGLVVAYGVVTFGLGVLLAAWPGRTLVVCAVIFAIQLLVSGTVRIVTAIASGHIDGWIRALSGLSGAVAVIVGLLCLRDPLQTLLVVGLLLGAWLLVCGMVDLMSALVGAGSGNRVWGQDHRPGRARRGRLPDGQPGTLPRRARRGVGRLAALRRHDRGDRRVRAALGTWPRRRRTRRAGDLIAGQPAESAPVTRQSRRVGASCPEARQTAPTRRLCGGKQRRLGSSRSFTFLDECTLRRHRVASSPRERAVGVHRSGRLPAAAEGSANAYAPNWATLS